MFESLTEKFNSVFRSLSGRAEQILEQVHRLGRTSDRLLSFARPAAPQQVKTSLKAVIENTQFLVGKQATRRGMEIRLDLSRRIVPSFWTCSSRRRPS